MVSEHKVEGGSAGTLAYIALVDEWSENDILWEGNEGRCHS